MQLRMLFGIGMISTFLFFTGCTMDPLSPKPSEVVNNKGVQPIKESSQSKAALSREFVYLSKKEKDELESIKKQPIIYKGSNHSKKVALTFDDGPDIEVTKKILKILKEERVPATFFVTGKMAKAYPQVLKQMVEEGHVIGNHTWNHPLLTKISPKEVERQIQQTNQIVEKEIGKKILLFRPPYGATNRQVQEIAKKNGFLIINWSVDTNDWRGYSAATIEQIVKQQLSNGAIVLQHNAGNKLQGTVEALPNIISYLQKQNYQLVTVDELLNTPPYKETTDS